LDEGCGLLPSVEFWRVTSKVEVFLTGFFVSVVSFIRIGGDFSSALVFFRLGFCCFATSVLGVGAETFLIGFRFVGFSVFVDLTLL